MSFWDGFKKGMGMVFNPILDAVPSILRTVGPMAGSALGTMVGGPAGTGIGGMLGGMAGNLGGQLSSMIPRLAHGGYVGGYPHYAQGGHVNSYAYGGGASPYDYAPPAIGSYGQMPMGGYGASAAVPQNFAHGGYAHGGYAGGGYAGGGIGLQDAINMLPMYRR